MDSFIGGEDNPVSGILQPDNGVICKLKLVAMPRRRKPLPDAATADAIMRRNIESRLVAMFPRASGATQRFEMLSKVASLGAETIRAFMVGERSPTLKNIVKVADAIGLTLPELFTDKANAKRNDEDGDPPSYLQQR